MPARSISALLASASGSLLSIGQQAHELLQLQQILAEVAPSELARSSKVGAFREGTLFLVAENGAVAAKLRQLAPRLLNRFRERENQVTGIRVDVQVAGQIASNTLIDKEKLSNAGIAALAELESALPESPLKAAVRRLRRRHAGQRVKTSTR